MLFISGENIFFYIIRNEMKGTGNKPVSLPAPALNGSSALFGWGLWYLIRDDSVCESTSRDQRTELSGVQEELSAFP